jgi:hypothetical protein
MKDMGTYKSGLFFLHLGKHAISRVLSTLTIESKQMQQLEVQTATVFSSSFSSICTTLLAGYK